MENNSSYSRHRIVLDERERLSINGVTDVIAFDEENVTADTEMGMVIIRGEGLHISRLDLEEGILQIEGSVDSIEYGDGSIGQKGGFILGKIFK